MTWALGANAITLSTEAGNLFGLDASMPHTPDDLLRLVLPNDRPLVQEHLACLRAGEQHDVEYRLAPARTDGSEAQAEAQVRWLRGRGRPEYDDTGAVVRVLGTLADVTAQKRQASIEQRFGRLLDAASSGIYIFRADTLAVEQVNSGAQQNLGYTAKALQNMTLLDIQPCTEDAFRNRARPLVDGTASMLVFETTHRRADGSTYPVEVRLQLSDRETPAVFIAIATDITKRKQYEAGLIEAKERAEEASRIKSAVVANMSHEVRTPLTAIIGFSEVLEEEIRDEQKRRFASRIQQSSKRLLATLNSVLHLSRLEAERQPLTHVTVDAVDVIREVTSAYAAQAQKKQVGLSAHTPASCRLLSDVDMLSRILTNLVSNAIKFTPAGGSVDVHAERPDASTVRFIVADTGIGMSTAFQRRMFEAFEQESTGTDRQHEGSGLGLTIVKRLVDLLGGTLDVRSQKGEGSAFSVTLPRQPPRASRLPPEGPPERP